MTSYLLCILAVAAVSVLIVESAKNELPSYFLKCSRSNPRLNICFANKANLAIPILVQGDKEYRFPVMDPLKINEISVDPSDSFHMGLKNVDLYGLGKTHITEVDVRLKEDTLVMHLTIPNLQINGTYETRGKILFLPIEGTGPALVNFLNGNYIVTIYFGRYKKDNITYLKVNNSTVTYDLKHATYVLDNLFNGNKPLGNEMNKFINENWKELSEEFRPAVEKTIISVMESVLVRLLEKIPEDGIYDP